MVAPVPAAGGQVLRRIQDRYSVVVHPFVAGSVAGDDGEFRTQEDRRTVLGLLIGIHGARSAAPYADDFVVPHLDELKMMMGHTGQLWDCGPYAERARALLSARPVNLRCCSRRMTAWSYGSPPGRTGWSLLMASRTPGT